MTLKPGSLNKKGNFLEEIAFVIRLAVHDGARGYMHPATAIFVNDICEEYGKQPLIGQLCQSGKLDPSGYYCTSELYDLVHPASLEPTPCAACVPVELAGLVAFMWEYHPDHLPKWRDSLGEADHTVAVLRQLRSVISWLRRHDPLRSELDQLVPDPV